MVCSCDYHSRFTSDKMKLIHITDEAFTDKHWQAYYSLMEILFEKYKSPMARVGWEKVKVRFLSLMDIDPDYYRFVVFDEETAVGWADLNVQSPGTSEQNVSVRIDAVYERAPDEFEKLVATEFLRLLDERKSTTAHLMAPSQRISAIARHWSSKELNRLDRFQLHRQKANISLMRSWLNKIPKANPDLSLRFFSPIPEKHLVVHTELFVTYIREMPTERETEIPFQMTIDEVRRDMRWRAKNDVYIYTCALFDSSDKMIAHSNASITGADPDDVYQAMTGVNREYRGRGLSRWLKAALFFKVGEDFPGNKTMTTDMRSANAPIQKVNAEMGYVLQSSGHEFEVRAEGLRGFLKS